MDKGMILIMANKSFNFFQAERDTAKGGFKAVKQYEVNNQRRFQKKRALPFFCFF
jgi:hypothetical protein